MIKTLVCTHYSFKDIHLKKLNTFVRVVQYFMNLMSPCEILEYGRELKTELC